MMSVANVLGRFGNGAITMQVLSGAGMEVYMPSNVVYLYRRDSSLRALLFKYGDDVIQHDYEGMIVWGIIPGDSVASMHAVLEVLSAWYTRMGTSVCDEFEKELLSQVQRGPVDQITRAGIIQNFPAVKHDMNRLELTCRYNRLWYKLENNGADRPYYHGTFKEKWKAEYDFSDKEDPSLAFVILRAILKSTEMSKHVNDECLGKRELEALHYWLRVLKKDDPDSFHNDKPALLLELLQNAKLDNSMLIETTEPARIEYEYAPVPYTYIGGSWYDPSHPWRRILELLREGAEQQDVNQQLPLHLLLAKGLPGQDILVDAYPQSVAAECPEENMHPFQLAAIKKDHGHHDEDSNLDREQISQIYSLMRAEPQLVYESLGLGSWEYDEEYTSKVTENYEAGRRLEQMKARAEEMKREWEEMKREWEETEKEIAEDEKSLAENRKNVEKLFKRKKRKTSEAS